MRDDTKLSYSDGWNAGIIAERYRLIALLNEHEWSEKNEKDDVLAILKDSYICECDGCVIWRKNNT